MASSSASASALVPTSEEDFLEQDQPIVGQNFVCLSFLSPEDVIKKKETYFFESFVRSLSADLNELFTSLKTAYPSHEDGLLAIQDKYAAFFQPESMNEEFQRYVELHPELEPEYLEKNNFQTTIRGIKVRGVYDTQREAQVRAEVLKRKEGAKHNIYIAQVGCWCPWAPNPSHIQDQEYAESTLNTMMKKYQENQKSREVAFEERKEALKAKAVNLNKLRSELISTEPTQPENASDEAAKAPVPEDIQSSLDTQEPWMQRKIEEESA